MSRVLYNITEDERTDGAYKGVVRQSLRQSLEANWLEREGSSRAKRPEDSALFRGFISVCDTILDFGRAIHVCGVVQ